MLKKVFFIRHAKAGWASTTHRDYDRPLSEQGERDAKKMGNKLKALGEFPEVIIASTARRTTQTACLLAQELGFEKNKIELQERIYHCTPFMLEQIVSELDSQVNTAFIIAHNPGITHFVNEIVDRFRIDDMPPCGVVGVRWQASDWTDFNKAQKEVFLFEYPAIL